MYTTNVLTHLVWGALVLGTSQAQGQASVLGHTGLPGDHLGWNNLTPQALEVRHDGNWPIEWYTNAIGRMRLSPDVTSAMGPLNEFPGVNRDGYLLLSGTPDALTNAASRAPFTRLHLVDQIISPGPNNYAQQQGFRPWQRNGITLTGNNDQSYIGHRYDDIDNTDLVIQWSDNPNSSPWGTDRMKFVFTTLYNPGASRGAATMNGLEAMRLFPATYTEVNVGIGDFAQTGVGDPTERVDMLDGRLRIRQLPDDPATEESFKVMVVDDTVDPERGVVKWVDPAVFIDGDCDWVIENDGTSGAAVPHNVYTAVNTNDDCPDGSDAVGIGVDLSTTAAIGKLNVSTNTYAIATDVQATSTAANTSGVASNVQGGTTNTSAFLATAMQGSAATADNRGVSIRATGNGQDNLNVNYGLRADLGGNSHWTRGVSASVTGGRYTEYAGEFLSYGTPRYAYGALAEAYGGGTIESYGARGTAYTNSPRNYGVLGSVTAGSNFRAGVYGSAPVAVPNNSWAGYFAGNVQITGQLWNNLTLIFSDENLKTDIAAVEGESAAEMLAQLQPKSYNYNSAQYPQMNFDGGVQFGFLAQEVEQIVPDLVSETSIPAELDSMGNVITEGFETKGINYTGMIPLLVAGHQHHSTVVSDLQSQIAAQNEVISQMQEMLAACCTNPATGERMLISSGALVMGSERALTIQPNPFNEHTTLYYTLERNGRMQLLANSADGKQLRVLQEANLEAGDYQHEWQTSELSPGIYYVTLLLDGEPIVKKAAKVQR